MATDEKKVVEVPESETETVEQAAAPQEERSTGEKIKHGLLDFGESVANKTKEAVEITRLKAEAGKLERKNHDGTKKLGELFKESGEATQEMKDLRDTILQNEKRLAEIDVEIEDTKGKYDNKPDEEPAPE